MSYVLKWQPPRRGSRPLFIVIDGEQCTWTIRLSFATKLDRYEAERIYNKFIPRLQIVEID